MSIIIDTEPCEGGLRITHVSTTDRVIMLPAEISGTPVVSLGESVFMGSPAMGARTLVIPSSIMDIDPETLEGSSGISTIEFDGELEAFCRFKVINAGDCTLKCRLGGEPYSFDFIGNHPMSFPEFDDTLLSLYLGLTLEVAAERITNPIGLTDVNRAKYEKFISDRIIPRAEQAVGAGDTGTLIELMATGLMSDDDLRKLLERSLRSGRVPVTSVIMSEIRRRVGSP